MSSFICKVRVSSTHGSADKTFPWDFCFFLCFYGEDVASIVFFDEVVVRYGLLPLIMGGVVVDLLPWLRLLSDLPEVLLLILPQKREGFFYHI